MKSQILLRWIKVLVICVYSYTSSSQDTISTHVMYDDCCGTAPKVYEVEDYRVYIPNVITPNGDGINDAFYPICNKMVKGKFAVANYWIYNDTGKIIYVLAGLDIEDAESWAFKGKAYKKPFKPREHERFEHTGKFKYTFILAFRKADNTEQLIEVSGEACVVRCDENAHILKGKEGCYFPIQGQNGIFNASIFPNEESCFK